MKRIRIECQSFRHEADFYKGPDTVLQQSVIDLVDIGEVVDGITVLIFVIDPHFVVQDGVKAHVMKVGDLLDCSDIFPVTLSQCENSPSRTKRLLPKVGK